MKKYMSVVIIGLLVLLLSSCGKKTSYEGQYDLVIRDSKEVAEFSMSHEVLTLDKNGNFIIESFYNRTYYFAGAYSSSFAGERVTNTKGKYYIKGNKIELEWFVMETNMTETYEISSNSIFKATYFKDGSLNSYVDEYRRIKQDERVNFNGTFSLDISKSNLGYYYNTTKLVTLNITDSTAVFKNSHGIETSVGSIHLGIRGGFIYDITEFSNNTPTILNVTNIGLELVLSNSNVILVYNQVT